MANKEYPMLKKFGEVFDRGGFSATQRWLDNLSSSEKAKLEEEEMEVFKEFICTVEKLHNRLQNSKWN